MKKLLLLLLLSANCFAIDPYTVLITQENAAGDQQVTRFLARPSADSYLVYDRTTDLPKWSLFTTSTISSTQITDSTSVGRSVLTASNASNARSAIGAGTSNFSGAYGDLSGVPTAVGMFTNDTGYVTASTAPVTSVNGQTGAITMTPAGMGAATTSHTHTASHITDGTTIGRSVMTATDLPAAKGILEIPTAVSQLTNDNNYATTSAVTATQAFSIQRANHTGTQAASTISDSTTVGRAVLTASTDVTARAAIGMTKYTGTTNGSGVYSVTYGSAYSVKPHLVFAVEGGTNKDTSILTSTTTTGFSVFVERRTDTLGLLPSYAAVSGITVNVIVTAN